MFRANIDLIQAFRQWLNNRKGPDYHRNMVVISASRPTINNLCCELDANNATFLLISERIYIEGKSALPRNINSQLGNEYTNVVFDARHDFSASSLYAASGLVKKSGNFILLTPLITRWPAQSAKYDKQMSYGQRNANSLFVVKLIQVLQASHAISWLSPGKIELSPPQRVMRTVKPNDEKRSTCASSQADNDSLTLSVDQHTIYKNILDTLQTGLHTKHIVLGKRGRGKSTLLAHIAVYARSKNLRVRYTANVQQNCNAIAALLQANNLLNASAAFNSPDQAAFNTDTCNTIDVLLIDEVASIAPDLIKVMLDKYKFVVMAGTYDGYEGTGRGLVQRLIPSIADLKHYELLTPMRWYESDPIEALFTRLFSPGSPNTLHHTSITPDHDFTHNDDPGDSLQIRLLEKETLIKNHRCYKEVVHLLTNAHYQTTPNDIKRILDESSYQLVVASKKIGNTSVIVGLAVCIEEGNFDEQHLSAKIAEGKRRVKGHLFAQNMALYIHCPSLLTFKYLRVQRIAVVDSLRRKGIASILLTFIGKHAGKHGQILCTNFGLTDPLVTFWLKNKFELVKVGQKIDGASGTLSGFFVQKQRANEASYPISSLLLKLNLELAFIKAFKPNLLNRIPQQINTRLASEQFMHEQIDSYLKNRFHRLINGDLQVEQLLPECYYLINICKLTEYEQDIVTLVSKGISQEDKYKSRKRLMDWIKKTRY